ncbi:IclR family transcriptional regulator [Fulvitalea axinellae]|uniref:IclR family transcriptional regulator n=1 Tax=Fulvitalea axinellae TaxID=1182444 RepID=A0AAU9DAR6_9BACT|nr:IclR family transcriptional regulator [Fulvitalea axinellae]
MEEQSSAPEKRAASSYYIPNVERALRVIELLADHQNGLSLPEMVKHLGISKSSLFRITTTLLGHNYLIRDEESKRFCLSRKVLSIGLSTISEHSLIEKALIPMRELRDELKETILLGVLLEIEGVTLEQVTGTHPFIFMLSAGKRFNLHASAPGKSILAFLPEHERKALLKRLHYEVFNKNTIGDMESLEEHLKEVRELGYAVDHAEEYEGVHCIGAPIFDAHGYPISAIWMTAPSARVSEEKFDEVGQKVKACAMRVSASFGYYDWSES